jgi:hypothetical protein
LFPERILFGDDDDEEGKAFSFRLFVVVAVDKRVFAPPVTRALFFIFSLSLMLHINLDTSSLLAGLLVSVRPNGHFRNGNVMFRLGHVTMFEPDTTFGIGQTHLFGTAHPVRLW